MEKTNRFGIKISRKGMIATAVVIIMISLLIESVIVNSLVAELEVMQRSVREVAVINAINLMEFAKGAMQHAVNYTFYQSSDDVLGLSGYCSFDGTPCDQDCKAPSNVPTYNCDPFWRVYENTYAPPFGALDVPQPGTFTYYLANRIAAVYNGYAQKFVGPEYCPLKPGQVTMIYTDEYEIRLDVNNSQDDPMKYEEENIKVMEYNTLFNETITVATFEIFQFGKDLYVTNDRVGTIFADEDTNMDNSWCGMLGERCDITSSCIKDCFDGSNCCCKGMFFGNVCEADMAEEYCEDRLSVYCSESGIDSCDYNNNRQVSADEKYMCDVENEIETPVYGMDPIPPILPKSKIEASASVGDCIKVDHTYLYEESGTTTVSWTSETVEDCAKINDANCGCVDKCTGDEANCGECIGIETGKFDGKCPWTTKTCPDECCAIEFTCTESSTGGYCTGSNSATCTAASCKQPCCDYTSPEPCSGDCSGCDPACKSVSCPAYGPCMTDCCKVVPYGGDMICVKRGCASCCDDEGSCSHKKCSDLSQANCEDCSGCNYVPKTWKHTISRNCRANACGLSCCKQTDTLHESVTCDYDYFGTAKVDVEVKDVINWYPIDNSWAQPALEFRVISGNAAECKDYIPVEQGDYVPDGSVCCPGITTNAADETFGCKSGEIIDFDKEEDDDEETCILDSDCCLPELEGLQALCTSGVCDLAPPCVEDCNCCGVVCDIYDLVCEDSCCGLVPYGMDVRCVNVVGCPSCCNQGFLCS
jgi:hypothetical protein